MKRQNLLEALDLVKPALSGQDFIPILSHFVFDGESVYAYDDVLAIDTECDFPLHGAVKGNLLLGLLNKSLSPEVKVEVEEDQARFKLGKSKINLPILPESSSILEIPDEAFELPSIELSEDDINGLEKCLISVGEDMTHPQQMGITVRITSDTLVFFSTNNMTISTYQRDGKFDDEVLTEGVILPGRFCEQMVRIAKKEQESVQLSIGTGYALAFVSKHMIFSKLINELTPLDFDAAIKSHLKDASEEKIPVPMQLSMALERALLVLADAPDKVTKVNLANGKLSLLSESGPSSVEDSMAINDKKEMETKIPTQLLLRALVYCNKMEFLRSCLLLEGDDFTHLVAYIS